MPAAIDQGPRQHHPEGKIVWVRVEGSAKPVDAEVRTADATLDQPHQMQQIWRLALRQPLLREGS